MNALLVDVEYCTGCHSCEVACKNEKTLELDQYGIKINEVGPFKIEEQDWVYNYVPSLTKICDLCIDRVKGGDKPSCVTHCLANVLEYGSVDELSKKMNSKGKSMQIMLP